MWAHIIGGSATKSFCFSCGNKMPFAGAPATCDLIPQSGNMNTCPLRHETVSYPEYKKGSYRSIDKQGGALSSSLWGSRRVPRIVLGPPELLCHCCPRCLGRCLMIGWWGRSICRAWPHSPSVRGLCRAMPASLPSLSLPWRRGSQERPSINPYM